MKIDDTSFAWQLVDILEPLHEQSLQLILVGGCSRSGKSTFSEKIAEEIRIRKYSATVLSMDSWIVDIDERPEKSSVYERYDGLQMVSDIRNLLKGQQVLIPSYDVKSRKRLLGSEQLVHVKPGYLILEGVLALAYDEFRQMACLSIFIEIDDFIRKGRFESFYYHKGLSSEEVAKVFSEREAEEVPAVKITRQNADVLFCNGQLIELARRI